MGVAPKGVGLLWLKASAILWGAEGIILAEGLHDCGKTGSFLFQLYPVICLTTWKKYGNMMSYKGWGIQISLP
jgi:hypothetical protein